MTNFTAFCRSEDSKLAQAMFKDSKPTAEIVDVLLGGLCSLDVSSYAATSFETIFDAYNGVAALDNAIVRELIEIDEKQRKKDSESVGFVADALVASPYVMPALVHGLDVVAMPHLLQPAKGTKETRPDVKKQIISLLGNLTQCPAWLTTHHPTFVKQLVGHTDAARVVEAILRLVAQRKDAALKLFCKLLESVEFRSLLLDPASDEDVGIDLSSFLLKAFQGVLQTASHLLTACEPFSDSTIECLVFLRTCFVHERIRHFVFSQPQLRLLLRTFFSNALSDRTLKGTLNTKDLSKSQVANIQTGIGEVFRLCGICHDDSLVLMQIFVDTYQGKRRRDLMGQQLLSLYNHPLNRMSIANSQAGAVAVPEGTAVPLGPPVYSAAFVVFFESLMDNLREYKNAKGEVVYTEKTFMTFPDVDRSLREEKVLGYNKEYSDNQQNWNWAAEIRDAFQLESECQTTTSTLPVAAAPPAEFSLDGVIDVDKVREAHHGQTERREQARQRAAERAAEQQSEVVEPPPPYVKLRRNSFVSISKRKEEAPVCTCVSVDPCTSRCVNRKAQVECTPGSCPSGRNCQNQRIGCNAGIKVQPFKTADNRGFGLHNKQPVKPGDYIIEYIGELIDDDELLERRKEYDHSTNHYIMMADVGLYIDATKQGGEARFINHSCSPNCEAQKWFVRGEKRVGIFALQDLPKDSEITIDYRYSLFGTVLQRCLCGSDQCCGFLGKKRENGECYHCGKGGDVLICQQCGANYHRPCNTPPLPTNFATPKKWYCSFCENKRKVEKQTQKPDGAETKQKEKSEVAKTVESEEKKRLNKAKEIQRSQIAVLKTKGIHSGDVVWAWMKGYHHFPAHVARVEEIGDHHVPEDLKAIRNCVLVFWIECKTHLWVELEKVLHFGENLTACVAASKGKGRALFERSLKTALAITKLPHPKAKKEDARGPAKRLTIEDEPSADAPTKKMRVRV